LFPRIAANLRIRIPAESNPWTSGPLPLSYKSTEQFETSEKGFLYSCIHAAGSSAISGYFCHKKHKKRRENFIPFLCFLYPLWPRLFLGIVQRSQFITTEEGSTRPRTHPAAGRFYQLKGEAPDFTVRTHGTAPAREETAGVVPWFEGRRSNMTMVIGKEIPTGGGIWTRGSGPPV
jgi:hypothetical protein